jgi:hypothetical protein
MNEFKQAERRTRRKGKARQGMKGGKTREAKEMKRRKGGEGRKGKERKGKGNNEENLPKCLSLRREGNGS